MKLRTIIIIIIVFIIGLIILKNVGNKQKNETLENALQLDETSINVQEKDIKGSVEGNHKGIEISNIKLMGNANGIITIQSEIKNTNKEEKLVQLYVVFYNENYDEIGRNGLVTGVMQPDETIHVKNSCYIMEANVSTIEVEADVTDVIKTDTKDAFEDGININ